MPDSESQLQKDANETKRILRKKSFDAEDMVAVKNLGDALSALALRRGMTNANLAASLVLRMIRRNPRALAMRATESESAA